MAYKIRLLSMVYTDLKKAKKWYLKKDVALAEEFKLEVNKEIDYIGKHPHHYQRKYKELRQSLVARFPYAVFYLVEEEQKQIIVFGVLDTSRNPDIVKKRAKN